MCGVNNDQGPHDTPPGAGLVKWQLYRKYFTTLPNTEEALKGWQTSFKGKFRLRGAAAGEKSGSECLAEREQSVAWKWQLMRLCLGLYRTQVL